MEGLLDSIQSMRKNEDMCDVNIKTKDGTLHPVHSLILAGASPVFKVMVTREFKELHSKVINTCAHSSRPCPHQSFKNYEQVLTGCFFNLFHLVSLFPSISKVRSGHKDLF